MAKIELKEYLDPINKTKEPIMDDPVMGEIFEKGYQPFIVNKCLHAFMDTILVVNEMNERPNLDKKMQFDFLLNSLSKRGRYTQWMRASKVENIDIVKEYYGYNNAKAQEALSILTKSDIEELKQRLDKGGR